MSLSQTCSNPPVCASGCLDYRWDATPSKQNKTNNSIQIGLISLILVVELLFYLHYFSSIGVLLARMYMCTNCVHTVSKDATSPLKPELQLVVTHYLGTRTRIRVL